jgi:hypothetical protein
MFDLWWYLTNIELDNDDDAQCIFVFQYARSLSLLLQIIMLGVIFVISHILHHRKVMIVHEAGAAFILGATNLKTLNPT